VTGRVWPGAEAAMGARAIERLAALDAWLGEQQASPNPSIHDLLTHVVDEVSQVCQDVHECMSGASSVPRVAEAAQ
jgi:hypothetical protein